VGSRKFLGWKACVASTGDEAIELTGRLLRIPSQARGRVMLRALLPLRRTGVEYAGFPLAREYRLFVLDGEVLARGAYWATGDPFGPPTDADLAAFAALSRDVFERTTIPWLSVDVGQLDDGAWRVIETGDPACAGLSAIEPGPLIRSLGAAMRARPR
jgi:hypothetical protein